jgi:hypothetical protein
MYTYNPNEFSRENEQQKMQMDRLDFERQIGKNSHDEDNNSEFGEITGTRHQEMGIDRGMPMRSQYTIKKTLHDENKYLDFDLHLGSKVKSNVQSNESAAYSSFADINASTLTLSNQIDPMYIVNNSFDRLGSNINEIFSESLDSSYLINTFGLYTLFGSLYLASDKVTQNEIEKFFNFPKKDMLHKCLHKMYTSISNLTDLINIRNFMIIDKNIPYNPEFIKTIKNFCVFTQVDINNVNSEANKFNYVIDSIMKTKMRNPILPVNLDKLQLMFMTVAVIRPIWTYTFEKAIQGVFNGYTEQRKENFLLSFSRSYMYCEDNENQLVEFKCGGKGEIGFGIVLPKKQYKNVSNENLRLYISHAKLTLLDEIRIPIFSQNLKLRYNGTLKKMGLYSVFLQVTAQDLFPQKVQLHDIIQNVKIIVDHTSFGSKDNTRGERSMAKFIANKPFTYYIRLIQTDTIILNGMYT